MEDFVVPPSGHRCSRRPPACTVGMAAASILVVILWISGASSTEWCRAAGIGTPFVDSFVKMTGITPATLHPDQRLLMYESPGNVVTAECHNRCRDSINCPAFLVDYVRGACYFTAKESEASWNRTGTAEVADAPTVGFFERACFRIPPDCGPRAWVIERVPGYILAGLKNMEDSPRKSSRTDCAQRCLDYSNSSPPCRSARYNSSSSECTLSTEDRRSQPDAFRASTWDVEYLENQCAPEAPQTATCSYQQIDNVTLLQADLQIIGLSPDECRARCGAEQSFRCRAFSVRPPEPTQGAAYICILHAGDTLSDGPSQLRPKPGAIYSERLACLDLKVSCSQHIMEVSLATPTPFSGRMYVSGGSSPAQCGVDGSGQMTTRLLLPLGRDITAAAAAGADMRCGLRLARAVGQSWNRTLVSAVVVVQKNPIIQTRGDRAVRVGCVVDSSGQPPGNDVAIGSSVMVSEPEVSGDTVTNSGKVSPIVRLSILDESGIEAGGDGSLKEVQLGQPLTLRIEVAKGEQPVGILATHLVASSADGRDSYLLLDSRGCPADPVTFPGLRPLPSGGNEQGGPYILESSFRAFRFPASPVVRFSLRVHFCPGGCPPVDCGNNISSYGRRRRSTDQPENTKSDDMPELEFPLQLAILVHTPRVVASPRREVSVGNSTILMIDPSVDTTELACVSSGALWGLAAAALVLQAAILMVCCYSGRRAVLSGLKCRRCGHDTYRCKGVCNGVASTKSAAYDNPTMLDRRVTWADE